MKRSEREITQREKLLELLDQCRVMHLGLMDGAAPYVVPLHFGWEEKEGEIMLYFHSAPEGRKMDCVRRNPSCFIAVTGDTRVIGSAEACGWTAAYESLMMEGEIEVLKSDEDKKTRAGYPDAPLRLYGRAALQRSGAGGHGGLPRAGEERYGQAAGMNIYNALIPYMGKGLINIKSLI